MGFDAIQTYMLARESGASLKAAGWVMADTVDARETNWGKRSKRGAARVPAERRVRWVRQFQHRSTTLSGNP